MNIAVALSVLAAWALAAATAAPSTPSAAAAPFAHQSALGSPTVAVGAAKERHGLPKSIHEQNRRIFPHRSSRRILADSLHLGNQHSQSLPHKKNIFVMRNDCKEGRSVPKPTDRKLRIIRADGTEVIFGTSTAIFRPQFQDEKANVGFQPCETIVTKSGHPRANLNRDNKVFIYVPEKQGMRENIPLFVISPRSSQFQSISKGVDNNEATGEINVSKAFFRRQPMFGTIKADKSLTKYQLSYFNRAGAEHRVAKRSPLELGLVQGLAVTHHGSAAPASTHHSVVLHPAKPAAHAVQVSALHGVAGLVTHAVIDPGLHITSTTVLTHDKPLLAHEEEPPHPAVVIPVVVKHEVVALAHPPLFRAHVGGFGVGLDFGGHGAGHGFYAAASAFAFR